MKHLCVAALCFLLLAFPAKAAAQSEVIPDQLIVKFKSGQSPQEIQTAVERRQDKASSFLGKLQNTAEDVSLRLRGQKTPEQKQTEIEKVEVQTGTEKVEPIVKDKNIQLVDTTGKLSSSTLEKSYERLSEVEYADPNYILKALEVPNDPLFDHLWGLQRVQAREAWDKAHGSKDVVVAVVDSGVDYTHPDLSENVIKGPDFLDNDSDPMDTLGHGTHVAGIIGAQANNGIGIAGISWQTKIMAVRVIGAGGGPLSVIYQGITYAADNGAKVINLSLGGFGKCTDVPSMQEVISYAHDRGTTVVVAAGNSSTDASNFIPASCNGVITVGATGSNDESTTYTNFGPKVDIAAPGGNDIYNQGCSYGNCILSTYLGASYKPLEGTSMAAPHVSGAAALLLSINPSLTPDQVKTVLKDSASYISSQRLIGKRLNLYNAVLSVLPKTPSPTPTEASSSATPTIASPSATPTSSAPLRGDINGDGCVGLADFERWKYLFVRNITAAGNPADVNQDGVIDILDYNEWFKALRTVPADKLCKP